jgi:short-subunit dehydrogenase
MEGVRTNLLRNTSFIVTGAGTGIGRETSIALAKEGALVTLVGRRRAELEETARLVSAAGERALVFAGDIAHQATHTHIIEAARSTFGEITGLINNAGNVRAGRLESISAEDILAMIDVNLIGPILLTRAVLPELKRASSGYIVNVSSGVALLTPPFYSVYAAVTSGIAAFGDSLRRELLDENVRIINVFPGATDTPMMRTNRAGAELGFVRESPADVAAAIVDALKNGKREVVRGGEARLALIVANRDDPEAVDDRFRSMKAAFEAAVSEHRSM